MAGARILDELPTLHQVPSLQPEFAESRQFGGCFVLGLQARSLVKMLAGISKTLRSAMVRCVIWSLLVTVVIVAGPVFWWTWLTGSESPGDTIRNLILVAVAIVALPLAIWRSLVAERQVETSRHTLANERFHKGVEMLSAQDEHVRIGGIYSLQHLSKEHPELYHLQTLRVFCSFLRSHAAIESEASGKQGAAIAEVLRAIGNCTAGQLEVDAGEEFLMNLSRGLCCKVRLFGDVFA